MKGIVVKTDRSITVQDFAEPLYQTVGAAVGGWIEIVRPKGLPDPYCMIINEEGLLKDLPVNSVGCELYRNIIAGDVVVMKEGIVDGEPDLVGLDPDEIELLLPKLETNKIKCMFCGDGYSYEELAELGDAFFYVARKLVCPDCYDNFQRLAERKMKNRLGTAPRSGSKKNI